MDRALDFEAEEDGSVILVEEGAELYIKDNSGSDAGTITGGASFLGGGICNYGTLTIQGGTITGNCAYDDGNGGGGGIYNEGTLTLLGGVITENEADYGGGIANAYKSTVTMEQSTYLKKVGVNSTEIIMNPEITANYAEDEKSHGIFNSGTINLQDSPVISGNEDNDIYCAYGKKLTITGALDLDEPIGVMVSGTNPTFTSGYAEHVAEAPDAYFTSGEPDAGDFFNKLYIGTGMTSRSAQCDLLSKGCNEFIDLDLNSGVADMTMLLGFRRGSIDWDAVNGKSTEAKQQEEYESQTQEAIYDIIITKNEECHPDGFVSRNIFYYPVSVNSLNTPYGNPLYLYVATPWYSAKYNTKLK